MQYLASGVGVKVGLDLKKCLEDFGYFAEHVLGLRLWKGQRKLAASKKFNPGDPGDGGGEG